MRIEYSWAVLISSASIPVQAKVGQGLRIDWRRRRPQHFLGIQLDSRSIWRRMGHRTKFVIRKPSLTFEQESERG